MKDLRLAFYGDDFTGSTDAMDALSKAGVDTVLFLETVPPGIIEQEFSDVDALDWPELAGQCRRRRWKWSFQNSCRLSKRRIPS